MTKTELYTRLLTELSSVYQSRPTFATRMSLQDVLIELRDMAAAERGDSLGQSTQDDCEAEAFRRSRLVAKPVPTSDEHSAPKRFLVFRWDTYYPDGGWNDFSDSYDDLEAAIVQVKSLSECWAHGHIIDLKTGKEILST